jgi:long-subunit acyl-CoA synthetase (AMP-forming)
VGTIAHNGNILRGIEVRLREWGTYRTTDQPLPRGELLVRTAVMAKRYCGGSTSTSSLLDEDGFFATGDVVSYDAGRRHIEIIDRCKNIFKVGATVSLSLSLFCVLSSYVFHLVPSHHALFLF